VPVGGAIISVGGGGSTPSRSLSDIYLSPANVLASTIPWNVAASCAVNIAFATSTSYLTPIALPGGVPIGHISFASGGTAGVYGTSATCWYGITDSAGNIVAETANQTSATLAAVNTAYPLAIATIVSGASTTYTPPSSNLYYLLVVFYNGSAGGTQPTLTGFSGSPGAITTSGPPIPGSTGANSYTAGPPALPASVGALTVVNHSAMAWVST
jgi:hypothetical protein